MNKQGQDVSAIFCEFVEVVIHTLLYNRKIYPDGIFTLKKKYGVPVHVSSHPELNKYISKILFAIKHLISLQRLKEIDICFFNKESVLVERFVLYLSEQPSEFFLNSHDSSLQQLKESFRGFCLKLSVNSHFMKPLPEGSTFKIFIHAAEDTTLSEDPQFQEFPWIEAQKSDISMTDPQIIPVRNIETNLINMKIYSEENPTAKDALQEDNRKYDVEIRKLEKELQRLQKEDPYNDKAPHLDCEKYRKYLEQIKIKESLKRQLAVDRERLRIMIEAKTDITEMNVDSLSQAELIRIVKQLERRKVDAASKLQQAENSLDSVAQEVAKLKDALKMYQTEMELRERKRGMTRLQLQKI